MLAGAFFSQVPLIINHFQLGIGQAPKLIAIVIFTSGIQIVTCIMLLKGLAHVCCVWLIAPSSSRAELLEQMTPIPWSIRGLMILTLAIAVAITAGQRLNWSGFDEGLLLRILVLGMNALCAGYLAAYYSGGGTCPIVAFGGMIALILLGAAFFTIRYLDNPAAFPNGIWMPVVFHLPPAARSGYETIFATVETARPQNSRCGSSQSAAAIQMLPLPRSGTACLAAGDAVTMAESRSGEVQRAKPLPAIELL